MAPEFKFLVKNIDSNGRLMHVMVTPLANVYQVLENGLPIEKKQNLLLVHISQQKRKTMLKMSRPSYFTVIICLAIMYDILLSFTQIK